MTRTTRFAGKFDQHGFYGWLNPEGASIDETYNRQRLLSEFVEIDDETYDYFLGMLPPMHFTHNHFAICEATSFDIRLGFFRVNQRYFAAHVSDDDAPYKMAETHRFIANAVAAMGA